MIILWRKGDSENRYLILLWREGIYLLDLLGDFRTSTSPPAGTTNPAHLPWAVGSLEEWLRDTKFRNHVNPRDVSKTPQWDFWMLKGTPVHPLLHESCLWQHISTGWYRRCLFLKEVPVKRKKGKGTPPTHQVLVTTLNSLPESGQTPQWWIRYKVSKRRNNLLLSLVGGWDFSEGREGTHSHAPPNGQSTGDKSNRNLLDRIK